MGKTGTAQKYDENGRIASGKYISSFIGTYPADEPEYLFMILVDQPSAGAYYGAIVAAPYGKTFFEKLFDFYNTPKDDNLIVLEEVIMPDLTGYSLANALAELKALGLDYEIDGDGGQIKQQIPPVGVKVKKGEKVLLIT